MTFPKDLKKQLRADALARRDALGAQWRIEASLDMAEIAGATTKSAKYGLFDG